MPPYQEIIDLLENNYNPNLAWRDQWGIIKGMAWLIEDVVIYLTHRKDFGTAITTGIRRAYIKNKIMMPHNAQISAIKENAIKDIESFRTTPEYWANI